METKYYTPSIEEFHLGFEYEHKIVSEFRYTSYSENLPLLNNSFVNDHSEFMPSIEEDIKRGKIRVKYLDADDIKELGWEPYREEDVVKLYEKKFGPSYLGKWSLTFWENDSNIGIYVNDDFGNKTVCNIKCYNKSELRFLMKRLEIPLE